MSSLRGQAFFFSFLSSQGQTCKLTLKMLKRAIEGILVVMELFCILSLSTPISPCDIVLQFHKMLPLGELDKGTWDSSVLFLATHVNLQLSQIKSLIFKK